MSSWHPPMTPTFGDFLDQARWRIDAVSLPPGELPISVRREIIGELDRLVTAMARYARRTLRAGASVTAEPAALTASDHEAPGLPTAFIRAADHLTLARRDAAEAGTSTWHPAAHAAATDLRAAANALAAGGDLLQTHFPSGRATPSPAYSPWAPIVASPQVTSALLDELSGYARHLAPIAAQLSAPARAGIPAPAAQALQAASQWLQMAGSAPTAMPQGAELEAGRQLLRTIPANIPPERQLPGGSETVAQLCSGATATSERLRHLALGSAGQDHWPPAATSACWRRNALAIAIVGHNSELILRALADRAQQLGTSAAPAPAIRKAADVMHRSWASWQDIARAWDVLTTGDNRNLSPVAAEIGDLVVWTGRLAHTGPDWTPARSASSPTRGPADLAPAEADLATVLATVERAAHVTAQIAQRNQHAVGWVAAEHGLFMPTRLLPAWSNVNREHRYSPALRGRTFDLLTAYRQAASASARGAAALRDLVIVGDTPGVAVAAARALSAGPLDTASQLSSSAGPSARPNQAARLASQDTAGTSRADSATPNGQHQPAHGEPARTTPATAGRNARRAAAARPPARRLARLPPSIALRDEEVVFSILTVAAA